ncbi:hypothetical protein Tco_1005994 [Tanacetum coccineum]|uniref:Reverse transcriptase Ty1/copia-type domain-containing protein n=1 Tax=Tanacetum coccineum TaxID=301880 RepID=A0ABQ5FGV9_9ASTR
MTGNKKLFSTYKAIDGGNVLFGSNTKSKIIDKDFEKPNHVFKLKKALYGLKQAPKAWTSLHPYQPLSPPSDYVSGTPPTTLTSQTSIPHLSPTSNNDNLLLTPKSTPPLLTSPPPTPTQPSKLTSPLAINLDPIELLFSTPPTSPQAFLDSLEDLPPATTNHPSPHLSFDTIERLANELPPIPPIDSSFPSPTLDMEPPILPFPPQCSPNPPSNLPPLPPLGPNNPFPMLTHEMFYEHCQQTQAIVDNFKGEVRFILNHILGRLNVLMHNY